MLKRIVKGIVIAAVVSAVAIIAPSETKAATEIIHLGDACLEEGCDGHYTDVGFAMITCDTCRVVGRANAYHNSYIESCSTCNPSLVPPSSGNPPVDQDSCDHEYSTTPSDPNNTQCTKCLKYCFHQEKRWVEEHYDNGNPYHCPICAECGDKIFFSYLRHNPGENPGGECTLCRHNHNWTTVREHCDTNGDYTVKKCSICGDYDWDTRVYINGENSGSSCTHAHIREHKDTDRMVHTYTCEDCSRVVDEHRIEFLRKDVSKSNAWSCYHEYCKKCYNDNPEGNYLDKGIIVDAFHRVDDNDVCTYCHKKIDAELAKEIRKHYAHFSDHKDDDEKEEKKEDKPKDLSKEAFGGREASQLSVAEQKSSVSYALDSLRASGNALAANVVTSNNGGNGKASDIAAVVADNRDAANQQIFAQVACANLGFKNVTPLATYNMYSLHSTYATKNGAQVITWANTGLKAGDTAFVVWYNQKLGKIELLPAMVDAAGNVLVNVPALGDVSTMTIVKATK